MVSVITCTNRNGLIVENVFQNFIQQKYVPKELIIILNRDGMKLDLWQQKASQYNNIKVYKLPEYYTLGECLNFGVSKAKYNVIAKFDDDDYYASNYLTQAIKALQTTRADIVGKARFYVYFEGCQNLAILGPRLSNKFVHHVSGATFVFKKEIFNKVKFRNLKAGSDVTFLHDSKRAGYRIYSTNEKNFAVLRRANINTHTWKIPNEVLLKRSDLRIICKTNDYKPLVTEVNKKINYNLKNRK